MMRLTIVAVIAVAGFLGQSGDALAQRPMTRGQQITAQYEMKKQMRDVARQELAKQQARAKSQRTWGGQDYYRTPAGGVINGRDLPPGAQQRGYKYLGNRDGGQPPIWARPYGQP